MVWFLFSVLAGTKINITEIMWLIQFYIMFYFPHREGKLAVVKYLVEKMYLNVNCDSTKDNTGQNPLHWACQ